MLTDIKAEMPLNNENALQAQVAHLILAYFLGEDIAYCRNTDSGCQAALLLPLVSFTKQA